MSKNIVERAREWVNTDTEIAPIAKALLDAVEALEWYADIPNEFSEETLEDKARATLRKLGEME